METKFNEATLNRPEGARILNAPFVFMDLLKYGKQIEDESAWKKNDRNSITICKTDAFTMVLCRLHKDAVIMDNFAGGHITIQLMQGKVEFSVGSSTAQIEEEQMITVHPGIMHTIHALEDSLILITTTKING